ncbi:hypothetical protein ACILDS_05805 [Capnocytophaga canis]|uniref:hypothetical protein n=1 Tax=Capnocytophaga canis TaxID=1848903 RepID=UPI0037D66CDA
MKRKKLRINRASRHSISNYQIAKPTQFTLINSMLQIFAQAESSKLDKKFFEKEAPYIEFVSKKLSISPIQTIFLSIFMEKGEIELSEMANFLEIHYLHLLLYINELEDLCERKFICMLDKKEGKYVINLQVEKAIINDETFSPTDYANSSLNDFFELLQNLFDKQYVFEDVNNEVKLFVENNPQLNFVQQLKNQKLSDEEQLVFLYLFYDHFFNSFYNSSKYDLKIHSTFASEIKVTNLLNNFKSSTLIKEKLIKKEKNNFSCAKYKIKKSILKRFLS